MMKFKRMMALLMIGAMLLLPACSENESDKTEEAEEEKGGLPKIRKDLKELCEIDEKTEETIEAFFIDANELYIQYRDDNKVDLFVSNILESVSDFKEEFQPKQSALRDKLYEELDADTEDKVSALVLEYACISDVGLRAAFSMYQLSGEYSEGYSTPNDYAIEAVDLINEYSQFFYGIDIIEI